MSITDPALKLLVDRVGEVIADKWGADAAKKMRESATRGSM